MTALAEFAGLLQQVVDELGWLVEDGTDPTELGPLMCEFAGDLAGEMARA